MGDYYYTTPQCKKCNHIQTEHVTVSDDSEFPSHFSCEKCFTRHTIQCHMEFDVEIEKEEIQDN